MKRTIKLHTGAAKTVEDTTHKIMTIQEWREEGTRRFGEDYMDWKFERPMCGHIASIRDFMEAGAKGPNCACQECLGRYTGKGSPKAGDASGCNWAAYGLFGIPNGKGMIVLDEEGIGKECFAFAGQEV